MANQRTYIAQVCGKFSSSDFYGPGRHEVVEVFVETDEAGGQSLTARKITGDENVPAGYLSWRTKGLPLVSQGPVAADVQIRHDIRDPNGFSWKDGCTVEIPFEDRILVTAWGSPGTFLRE